MTSAELCRPPSTRTITRPITLQRDQLTKAETLIVAAIKRGAPALVEAQSLVDRFQSIVRRKAEADLDPWLQDAGTSLIASFARGIVKDLAAVRAAITEPWSNGQTEGHVNRLKLVKRQMYGRAKLDLLEAPHRSDLIVIEIASNPLCTPIQGPVPKPFDTYDSKALRASITSMGAKAVIPRNPTHKIAIPHDPVAYKHRNRIGRCFNRMKHFRRFAIRYDRRTIHFLGFTHLAAAMIWMA